MVDVDPLDDADAEFLREVAARHHAETGSAVAAAAAGRLGRAVGRFTKVMPQGLQAGARRGVGRPSARAGTSTRPSWPRRTGKEVACYG